MVDGRLARVLALIDAENSKDPNQEDGRPAALRYSERMTEWLGRIAPDAGEELQIAVRAQHLRRWEIPRDTYRMDRPGYHAWRNKLKVFHAECVAELMRTAAYEDEAIAAVQSMVQKKRLRRDPNAQTLEDVACLVFLTHYFTDFRRKHSEEKLLTILQRTWGKMSAEAQATALGLPLPPAERRLLEKALGEAPPLDPKTSSASGS
ncbi:MAG: DUF4202 domain-containing protein [Myxococcota bacterium]